MENRRRFIKRVLVALSAVKFAEGFIPSAALRLFAQVKKRMLPKGTQRESLINENPASLDASRLEITPLPDFGVMGLSDHLVDTAAWKLEVVRVDGTVMTFSYPEILALPALERKVLMICPGVFANIGLWKGVSIKTLLSAAGPGPDVIHVTLSGPKGDYTKVKRFPMKDIRTDRVFLAYQINGKPLPPKHGFPFRVVAEDYFGYDWVKFVDRMVLQAT